MGEALHIKGIDVAGVDPGTVCQVHDWPAEGPPDASWTPCGRPKGRAASTSASRASASGASRATAQLAKGDNLDAALPTRRDSAKRDARISWNTATVELRERCLSDALKSTKTKRTRSRCVAWPNVSGTICVRSTMKPLRPEE